MGALLDLIMIASIVGWIFALWRGSDIPPTFVGGALVGLVGLFAIARARNMSVAGVVLRAGLPIGSLAAFVFFVSAGDVAAMEALVGELAVLIVVLSGFYIMIWGAFGGSRRRR
jgi:hypothetical protein